MWSSYGPERTQRIAANLLKAIARVFPTTDWFITQTFKQKKGLCETLWEAHWEVLWVQHSRFHTHY